METPVISIVACRSGTGKTTVLERLIAELNGRGWKVGAVKNAGEKMDLDKPGKDSWRFAAAGACAVAVLGQDRYAVIRCDGEIKDLLLLTELLQGVDIVFIEGNRPGSPHKVEVIRSGCSNGIITPPHELIAVVTDIPEITAAVPVFSFAEIVLLADFIEQRYLKKTRAASAQTAGWADMALPEMTSPEMTHFDQAGRARMVDVSEKEITAREATARGEIVMGRETLERVKAGRMSKGDVLAVAQVAAVMGVKETSRLIPMCHPLPISAVSVEFAFGVISDSDAQNCSGQAGYAGTTPTGKIEVTVTVKLNGQTGVEMEALTGVSTALLTIYDMCKAVDKNMVIGGICLLEKKGGRSGHFIRN